jgi:endonuclease/exonuclease/phosphatase family metal-dependent hydrolase
MRLSSLLPFILIITLSCQEEIQKHGTPNNGPTDPVDNFPENPVSGKYANCLSILSENTLDIVTWNIEQFPKENTTVAMLTEMINTMDPDIIAVQEINSLNAFNQLVASLDGWAGKLHLNGSLGQGFLYKTSEVTLSDLTLLFTGDTYAFTRPLVVATALHESGKQVTLINVHLKCCDDGEARRKDASVKLKAYLDANLASQSVIVLGDFNDEITEPSSTNVFQNFIHDAVHYKFADMTIANGASSQWSYPSWPSHIDHLLITDELFNSVVSARTLTLGVCETNYTNIVSDHSPVMIRLQ